MRCAKDMPKNGTGLEIRTTYLTQPSGRRHILLQPLERALVVFQEDAGLVAAAAPRVVWNVALFIVVIVVRVEE